MPDLNVPTPATTGDGVGYSFGARFSLSAAREAHAIRWYRSGSTPYAVRLSIRDDTTGLVIYSTVPNAPVWVDGGGGWWYHSITAELNQAIPLPAGHSFRLSYYLETTGSLQAYNAGGAPSPDSPATWIGNSYDSGDTTYPNQAVGGNVAYGVDLTWEVVGAYVPTQPVGEPGDPPTNENLTARLAEWNSADPVINTHHLDGLPWLAYQYLLLVGATNDAIKVATDASLAILNAAVGSGGDLVTGSIRVALDALTGWVHSETEAAKQELLDNFGTRADAIDAALVTISGGTGLTRDTQPIPGSGWALADTVAFSGTKAWATPADRYVYHLTAWGAARQIDYRDGVEMLWFRGWAAPLNGTLVGRHQTVNAVSGEIYEPGLRFPGVIFSAPPDIEVTLEAWVFG